MSIPNPPKLSVSLHTVYGAILLLIWVIIGAGLRFAGLGLKPPWTDELTTMIFSLGNTYQAIPLNQIISPELLLQTLQPNPDSGVREVIGLLLKEDVHPPLYFALAHLWQQLFSTEEYLSVSVARSLPAIFGVLSIPATYWLGKVTFKSRLVAHCSAAMMTVSPYAIFLAQEARHYTLAIIFVIFSLGCLVVAIKCLWRSQTIPLSYIFLWLVSNSFGFATHYFFCLTLIAEAITLLVVLVQIWRKKRRFIKVNNIWRLSALGLGTLASGLVWLPSFITNKSTVASTDWIQSDVGTIWAWFNPPFQALAAWITMLSLLPVEVKNLPIVIASGAIMLLFFVWSLPILWQGFIASRSEFKVVNIFAFFVAISIAIFFLITYLFGVDLTRGARYNFVYFPGIIVILGASLATCWQQEKRAERQATQRRTPLNLPYREDICRPSFQEGMRETSDPASTQGARECAREVAQGNARGEQGLGRKSEFRDVKFYVQGDILSRGKKVVIIIWLMGLFSSLTVCLNGGYQKYYRPDLLVPIIQENSSVPILIATTHTNLVHKGEMLGLAWQLHQQPLSKAVNFLILNQDTGVGENLQNSLQEISLPLDLWLINFHAETNLEKCVLEDNTLPHVDGYDYQLYHCGT